MVHNVSSATGPQIVGDTPLDLEAYSAIDSEGNMKGLWAATGLLMLACTNAETENTPRSTSATVDSIATTKTGTKLASFQAKTGAVIISGFSTIGTVRALYGARIGIDAREATDASDGTKIYGVAIEVKEGGTLERENTSYVDYDELESLLKGIDYIAGITRTVTALANFQADYRTKGDLALSTFSSSDGQTLLAVKSGSIGGASAFFRISDLATIRGTIAQAKQVLDSIRVSAK